MSLNKKNEPLPAVSHGVSDFSVHAPRERGINPDFECRQSRGTRSEWVPRRHVGNGTLVKSILKETALPVTGIAPFSRIKNNLIDCRAKSRLPENPMSIIMTAVSYKSPGGYFGSVARFAAVPDYHRVLGGLLESAAAALLQQYPGHEFVPFTDNSPIPEVYTASLAGLGVIGKYGLLITPDYGSFVVLGEIVTTLKIRPDIPSAGECLNCGNCLRTCPRPESLTNKTLCVSGITQKKGELTECERKYIKSAKTAWGCDCCQNECPHNIDVKSAWIPEFTENYTPAVTESTPLQGRVFEWRGRETLLRNLRIIKDISG